MEGKTLNIGKKEVRIPLLQGGMGVGISLGGLAGAVAKEGAVGMISAAHTGYREPDFYTNTVEANKRAIHSELKKVCRWIFQLIRREAKRPSHRSFPQKNRRRSS